MSSRRSRSRQSGSSGISDDQIIDLVSKLQQLLPEIRNRRSDKVHSTMKNFPIKPSLNFLLTVMVSQRKTFDDKDLKGKLY